MEEGKKAADPQAALKEFRPRHEFFVGIDSDGCVFDTMEVKHKECFIPNIIRWWGLQAVSKYAREAAEFVNLYSRWRGINRFPALTMTFDLLAERPEVARRGVRIEPAAALREWIRTETRLGNPALAEAVARTNDPVLERALGWSEAVNRSVAEIVEGVPPFPFAAESIERLSKTADIVVVSATPGEALNREWEEHGIARFASIVAGQEMGTKKEHLELAAKGKYAPGKVLMIGDAPGDLKAARANGALFFPVNPGREEESWERFHSSALDAFLSGRYTSETEAGLVREFERLLPSEPPWKR